MQERFAVLREHRPEWSASEIIRFVHVCVIIHDMLVRMQVHGAIEDEVDSNRNALRPNKVIHNSTIQAGN